MSTQKSTTEPVSDPARIDEAVLALLWLTATTTDCGHGQLQTPTFLTE